MTDKKKTNPNLEIQTAKIKFCIKRAIALVLYDKLMDYSMPTFNILSNIYLRYFIIGLSTFITVYILYTLNKKIKHMIDVYENNTMYALDENGVRLKEGDLVEVKAITSAGLTTSKHKIIRDTDGYLKCQCLHGLQPLRFFDPQSEVPFQRLKKIENE